MKKTLYSLMLSEEVVHEIDLLAHRLGTNRSSLVNRILAEHVQLRTPEQRFNDIFTAVEQIMSGSPELVLSNVPNTPSIELRSCLEYKYRPTVRYEIEMLTHPSEPSMKGRIGTLSVLMRTQSAALITMMTSFFTIWQQIESRLIPLPVSYTCEECRFTRSLSYPTANGKPLREISANQLAEALSGYIKLLDQALKGYVSGSETAAGIAEHYRSYLKKQEMMI